MLRLCRAETITNRKDWDEKNLGKYHTQVTLLPDKEGTCVQVAIRANSKGNGSNGNRLDNSNPPPTKILAFENTISLQLMPSTDNRNEDNKNNTVWRKTKTKKELRQ